MSTKCPSCGGSIIAFSEPLEEWQQLTEKTWDQNGQVGYRFTVVCQNCDRQRTGKIHKLAADALLSAAHAFDNVIGDLVSIL
jgi:hypothetical protein